MMNKLTEKLQEEVEHSEWLTDRLKCVAKSIEFLNLPQPDKCLFGYGGSCCYPIDDCLNCPCHPWSVNYMPLVSGKFK